ncbi:MAG: hypothetical protein JJU20_13100 [Opitutales bacterium]|nr:hypothetical protein [Opitutales bacterium]
MNRFLDSFSIGQRLLDAPVPALIESLGKSIAKAQYEMDATGVQIGALLGETKIPLKDENGKVVERSLLELGFSPTFYHFQEVELEVKMTITLEVEAGVDLDMTEGAKSLIPMGSPVSLDVHGRFGYEQEGSSRVTAKLVSVPSPSTFTEALRRHAGANSASKNDSAEPEEPEEPEEPTEPEEPETEET